LNKGVPMSKKQQIKKVKKAYKILIEAFIKINRRG